MAHAANNNFCDSSGEKSNLKQNPNRMQTVQFIADMLLELRNMAKHHEFRTLQGLIEITYYEAYSQANLTVVPDGEEELLALLGADARKAARRDTAARVARGPSGQRR